MVVPDSCLYFAGLSIRRKKSLFGRPDADDPVACLSPFIEDPLESKKNVTRSCFRYEEVGRLSGVATSVACVVASCALNGMLGAWLPGIVPLLLSLAAGHSAFVLGEANGTSCAWSVAPGVRVTVLESSEHPQGVPVELLRTVQPRHARGGAGSPLSWLPFVHLESGPTTTSTTTDGRREHGGAGNSGS